MPNRPVYKKLTIKYGERVEEIPLKEVPKLVKRKEDHFEHSFA